MAMNPYFPASYMPYQYPQYQAAAPATQSNGGLIWVQGIEGAKAHPVSAGQSVLLMDSDSNCFFIKSADMSGMPLPLRVFDYKERAVQSGNSAPIAKNPETSAYITREEFESRIAAICAKYEKESTENGE